MVYMQRRQIFFCLREQAGFRFPADLQCLSLKGNGKKILSSHLKETPKQYIEVYYRILISALFGEIF